MSSSPSEQREDHSPDSKKDRPGFNKETDIEVQVQLFKTIIEAETRSEPPQQSFLDLEETDPVEPNYPNALRIELGNAVRDLHMREFISAGIRSIEQEILEKFRLLVTGQYQFPDEYIHVGKKGMILDTGSFFQGETEEIKKAWERHITDELQLLEHLAIEQWQKLGQQSAKKLSIDTSLIPKIADRYVVLRELGHGGEGEVFLAWHIYMRKKVALKILPISKKIDRERFNREVSALAMLDHPRIIRIHTAGSSETVGYYVMDYVEGVPLGDYVDEENPPDLFGHAGQPGMIDIIIDLLEAIEYLHGQDPPVVHHDIKPDNVLFDGRHAKLIDFGIISVRNGASVRDFLEEMRRDELMEKDDEAKTKTHLMASTEKNFFLGTIDYLAPEIILGDVLVDPRCDIYSAGVTIFQLLAGKLPIDTSKHKEPAAILLKHIQVDPTPLQNYRYDLPKDLTQLVMSMLDKNPERRPTAQQVLETLIGLRERWKADPFVFAKSSVREGPGTDKMKTLMARRAEKEKKAIQDTEIVTHADH